MRVPNQEFQAVNAFAPYLLAQHKTDILAEVELTRRARLATKSQPGVPAWRRSLGGAFAYAARAVDPSTGKRPVARRA
jgi:hypothetical protein